MKHTYPCLGDDGMTLRDYFAASVISSIYVNYVDHVKLHGWDENWKALIAVDAYALADAMLAERDK